MIKKIFISGVGGFPFKVSAPVEKNRLIAKTLNMAGFETYIVNKVPGIKKVSDENLSATGISEDGIKYIYTCGTPYSGSGKFGKAVLFIKGFVNETLLIIKEAIKKELGVLIVSYMFFPLIIYYSILTKLFGVKLVIHIMEHHISMTGRSKYQKLNDKFFDRYSFYWSDGVIVISDFLGEIVHKISPRKPVFKLPAITDFDRFDNLDDVKKEKYFLYCGSASFFELIEFIVDSFRIMPANDHELHFVLGGSDKSKDKARKLITDAGLSERIKIFSNLSYEDLFYKYSAASGLLIPLRPTIQDRARFPHKISEYLASGSAVVTTNFGEVASFFVDGETALVADEYTPESYCAKMFEVVQNPHRAEEIGKRGKEFGKQNFNYKAYSISIESFLRRI